jgi:hypothetical protein
MAIVALPRELGLVDTPVAKAGPGKQSMIPFILDHWDFENSPAIQDKLAHGIKVTKKYCHHVQLIINRHWTPYFQNRTLNTLSKTDIRDFSLFFHKKGLSPKTINNVVLMGTVALKWAYTEGIIPMCVYLVIQLTRNKEYKPLTSRTTQTFDWKFLCLSVLSVSSVVKFFNK